MKRGFKKFLGILLVAVMVFAMGTTVLADDTCTITINGTDGAVYSAYKLMDVTVSGTNYSYTVNSKYSSILSGVLTTLDITSTTDVVTYLEGLSSNSSDMRAFADAVYAAILADNTISADYTSSSSEMTVAYGYYLIAETTKGSTSDTYSLVMLNTAAEGTATISTKEDAPTLVKKIQDTNDSTGETSGWQDSADADIGDAVSFQLTGTVSSYYDSYATYYYAFHDKMDDGLTFNESSVVVTIDGTTVASSCYSVNTGASLIDSECDFEVVFTNLKTGITDTSGNTITVASTSSIVVSYTATLNSNAVLGSTGNLNYAKLVYNNNPYYTGSGQPEDENTSETPWDQVVVLTYKLQVNKVVSGTTDALEGATFTLEKYDASTSSWKAVTQDSSSTESVFYFVGLDDGDYRITETAAPSGYNKLSAPIYFTVTATHTIEFTTWESSYLTAFSSTSSSTATHDAETGAITVDLTATASSGIMSVDIENESGSVLPTTGGIGTTIFYIVGAVLVVGAGEILITRRRMNRGQ